MALEQCLICGFPAEHTGFDDYDCFRCGKIKIRSMAATAFEHFHLSPRERANMSGALRENPQPLNTPEDVTHLRDTPTPSVAQRADKLFSFLQKQWPKPGTDLAIDSSIIQELFSAQLDLVRVKAKAELFRLQASICGAACAENYDEVGFLLEEYLCKTKEFLVPLTIRTWSFKISPKGWDYLEHGSPNVESAKVFVAMSFNAENPKLLELYQFGIEKGLEEAGYEAIRVDRNKHLNLIDDEIMAGIRKSRFIVADLTDQRQGVYFEAGFAKGLGLKVVWTCEKQEAEGKIKGKEPHFDVNHYPILAWEESDDKFAVFRKRLQELVEANYGKGKFKRP